MKRIAAVVSWTLCFGLILSLCAGVPMLAQEGTDEAVKHVNEGLRLFDQGELDKASAEIEQALRLMPGSSQALALLEKVGEQKIYKLLANEKTRGQAMQLFQLAEKEEARKTVDPAEMAGLLKDLSGDFPARWRAITGMVQIGDYAVPYVLNLLDTAQPTQTTAAAQLALKKIGWRGVLPLIEALHSDSAFLRQNVCAVLANVGDARAVPALKAIVECPEEGQDVRLAAANALEAITGQPVGKLESAADLYYALAEKYYYENPPVMRYVGPITPVWSWNPCPDKDYTKRVVFFPEPDYAYNEIMAEHFCLAGLKCNPQHYKLRGLLTATYYALISETDAILTGAKRPGLLKRQPTEEEMNEMKARQEMLKLWRNDAAASGSEFINAALKRTLTDGDPFIAIACIEGLRALDDDRPVGKASALGEALRYKDKMVRYAAADALIHLSPEGRLGDADLTMKVMAAALGESGKRTILLLEPDLQNRNRVKAILKSQPYTLLEADSMNKAREQILLGVPPVDLLIMAEKVGGAPADGFARSLKGSAEAVNMAIFVLADPSAVQGAQTEYGPAADAVFPANVSDSDLLEKIQADFQKPAAEADQTAAVAQVIKRSCAVLAEIDRSNTKYAADIVVPALLGLVSDKDSEVRRLALDALGHMGRSEDRKAIAPIVADASCAKEVRLAAIGAIEKIMKRSDKFCPCCEAPLKAAIADADPELAAAAARAIGNSPAGAGYVLGVFEAHQMIPLAPAPAAAPEAKAPAGKFAFVKDLMMCMKKNSGEAEEAMKAMDMEALKAKLSALSECAEYGKANFAMSDMLGQGYDMMKMACDKAVAAAGEGDADAFKEAAEKCKATCMECHKNCRK